MISKTFFLVFLTTVLFTAGIFSTVSAQSPGTNNGSNSQNKLLSTIIPKKSFGVRITSPMTGDQVFINGTNYFNKNGEKLSIQGTSASDTNSSSSCSVSIIVNSVKPYQTAIGTGSKGNNEYSTWKYSFTPLYIPLKEGSNKITSKLTCQPGNTAAAFYSVNVTGSKINGTFPNKGATPMIVQSKSFNNAAPLNLNTKSIVPAPTTTNNAAPLNLNTKSIVPAPTTATDQPNSTIPLEFKSMNIVIDKKGSGNRQTIVITVRDSITDKPVGGVSLSGNINNETFSGITNSSGKFSKGVPSSIIKSSSTIDITVTGTADGYKSNKASTTFDITSSSNSTTGTKNNGKSGAKDMASKIANDVQNQLSKQGINIPLPFG